MRSAIVPVGRVGLAFLFVLVVAGSGLASGAIAPRLPSAGLPGNESDRGAAPPNDPLRTALGAAREPSGPRGPPADRFGPRVRPDAAPAGVPVDGAIGPGVLGTGDFPYGGAYDPVNQELYVANEAGDNVTVLNATTGARVADLNFTSDPLTATYVPSENEVYVSLETSHELALVDPSNNSVVSTIDLAGDPEYTVYDPVNGELYLSEWSSPSAALGVQAVDTDDAIAAPVVRTGFSEPLDLTVDTQNDTIWVMDLGDGHISILSGLNDTVVHSFTPGPFPSGSDLQGGIVYAPVGNQVFVDNDGSPGVVDVFDASNYSLLRSGIPVGAHAYGQSLTYDPASECVYVGSYFAGSVTVISAVNDSIAAPTLLLAGEPWVGIYDSGTGALFFLLASGNATAWIFGGVAVNATVSGLPNGTAWSITLDGVARNGTGPVLPFVLPVGRFAYSVGSEPGYGLPPSNGTVVVPASPLAAETLPVPFEVENLVRFDESGLPSGSSWRVDLDGQSEVAGAGAPIDFEMINGSSSYSASTTAPGYEWALSGSPTVALPVDGPTTVAVGFVLTTYSVSFLEQGLPVGTEWAVDLAGAWQNSSNASDSFEEPNGTYAWAIRSPAGYSTDPQGTVTVLTANRTVNVTFAPVTYLLTFEETGLPVDTDWAVTLDGQLENGSSSRLAFAEPNGTYPYTVGPVARYAPAQSSGSATVLGSPTTVTIAFVATFVSPLPGSQASPTVLGLPAAAGYAVIGVAAGGAAVALVVVLLRRRGPGGTG